AARGPRPRGARCEDLRRSRQIRSHHPGQSKGSRRQRPLGRADHGIPGRTLLRAGPARRPALAPERKRPSAARESMRRIALIAGGVAVALILAGWLATMLSPSTDLWLYRRMAMAQLDRPAPELAKDGELSVLLCGSGSPLPDFQRASACTLIAAGNDLYV